MPSESSTRSSSNSTPAGRAGLVPVAITMYSPVTVMRSPRCGSSTSTVCGVDEPAVAREQVDAVAHQLRAHDVLISLPMTWLVRASRSAGVIFSLTR